MELTVQSIVALSTMLITYIFGLLAKKFNWIDKVYIPLQNVLIGIVAGLIVYCIGLVDDLTIALITCLISALGAGGTYDLTQTKGVDEHDMQK